MMSNLLSGPVLFALFAAAPAQAEAQAVAAADRDVAPIVTDLSANGCYGIVSGTIALPRSPGPDGLDRTIRAVENMGLTFGVPGKVIDDLGSVGQTLLARATMGSKPSGAANIVVAFDGAQPGCRVMLVADAPTGASDAVGTGLTRAGWKSVPQMDGQRGPVARRAFVKRDAAGNPYLMNMMTIADPPSKLRLVTTTIRIPPGVALPPGF